MLGSRDQRAARDRVSYLPEERGLYKKMVVRDVLMYHARLKGMQDPRAEIERWLDRLDIAEAAGKKVTLVKLSGEDHWLSRNTHTRAQGDRRISRCQLEDAIAARLLLSIQIGRPVHVSVSRVALQETQVDIRILPFVFGDLAGSDFENDGVS